PQMLVELCFEPAAESFNDKRGNEGEFLYPKNCVYPVFAGFPSVYHDVFENSERPQFAQVSPHRRRIEAAAGRKRYMAEDGGCRRAQVALDPHFPHNLLRGGVELRGEKKTNCTRQSPGRSRDWQPHKTCYLYSAPSFPVPN